MRPPRLPQVKGKVTLFNVGSSFIYEAGINGSRRKLLLVTSYIVHLRGPEREGFSRIHSLERPILVDIVNI